MTQVSGPIIHNPEDNQDVIGETEYLEQDITEHEYLVRKLADIELRLDGLKIDIGQILTAFEELGNQFEGAVSGFLDGPMGKLMGKLMGSSKLKEEEVEPDGDGDA